MKTRCLSCGDLIDGGAQMCEACEEREQSRFGVPDTTELLRATEEEAGSSGFLIDAAVLGVIGIAFVGGVVWLMALGGADTVGIGGGGDDEPAAVQATATQTSGPAASLAPLGYESADCIYEAPGEDEAECGYLTVPQDRADPDAGRVRLPVAVFKSTSSERRPDPVIYLDGGPGGNTLEGVEFLYAALEPLTAERDLILFDQRGAGESEPALDCPEVGDVDYDHLIRKFSLEERVAQDAASVRGCYDRLVAEGIDPTFATSAESAADVNDLRIALGYEEVNLYGVSYGTKLALTIMRDYPDGVRSVILDSTYPLQSDFYAEFQADFDRALGELFDACASDLLCGEAYPNLQQAYYETVDRLNDVPVQFSIGAVTGRPPATATIDGIWFNTFIFGSLYSEELVPLLPQVIFDTRDHEYDLLKLLADVYLQDSERVSQGMYLSVQCGEEAPFTDWDAVMSEAQAHPRLPEFSEYSAESLFVACEEWHSPPASAAENERVSSSIPTLVVAGQFDPITPPEWGRLAAESLENSYFFEFPGLGHGVALSGDCPTEITFGFLENPEQEPASGCIASMSGPFWGGFQAGEGR